MANKIKEETLIYLDWHEATIQNQPLPKHVISWIAKHGVPKEDQVLKRQRNAMLPNDKKAVAEQYKKAIQERYHKDGSLSELVIQLCKEALQSTSISNIAKWINYDPNTLRNIVKPDPEYIQIKELLDQGEKLDSPKLCDLYRKFWENGASIYKLKKWTGFSKDKIRKIVKNRPKYH